MIPVDQQGFVTIESIDEGYFTVDAEIVHVRDEQGNIKKLTMIQNWPVRNSLSQTLLNSQNGKVERLFPSEPLITQQRIIDTFFPIAHGGTACIPGPFGAGKTVLQQQLSKYSAVDIVLVVACGERVGEVVETIEKFPAYIDFAIKGLYERSGVIRNEDGNTGSLTMVGSVSPAGGNFECNYFSGGLPQPV